MEIKRTRYLEQLIRKRENGLVKVVTGVRRCGKSYLLNNIYYNYLRAEGVAVLLFNYRGALLRAIKAIKRQKVHPASRRSTLSRV